MPLLPPLRALLGEPEARSFQLMGEDLVLIGGTELREAAARYEEDLRRAVPAELREERERELSRAMTDAHRWLKRYNRALPARIQGYLSLGERCGFAYPWPVVALVGLCAVTRGLARWRLWGLVGDVGARVGAPALRDLASGLDDTLLRTNRGIFADSVPTVILALRCHELRGAGRAELAEALLAGPLPPLMDEETRALGRALYDGLGVRDADERFARLAEVTELHFAREQAVFSFHMGRKAKRGGVLASLARLRSVEAPRIVKGRSGLSLVFEAHALPSGFEMEDHDARVREFGKAFVQSITGSAEEYEAAKRYVMERFGTQKTSPRQRAIE